MPQISLPTDTLSIAIVVCLAAVAAVKIPFLKNHNFMRLSLLRILYLIFIPGILFIILTSYAQNISTLPKPAYTIFSDRMLLDVMYLSLFYTYGGLAIHTVTKSLAEKGLRLHDSEAANFNRYFHLTFSHNLIYGGAALIITSLALLEMNHVPVYEYDRWLSPIARGLGLGFTFVAAIYFYNPANDGYRNRWTDLRIMFTLAWAAFALILFMVIKTDAPIKQYQFLLPTLLALGLVNTMYALIVIRHLHRKKLTPWAILTDRISRLFRH